MSTTKLTRQRVLRAADEQHPVAGLIDQAEGTAENSPHLTSAPAPARSPVPDGEQGAPTGRPWS